MYTNIIYLIISKVTINHFYGLHIFLVRCNVKHNEYMNISLEEIAILTMKLHSELYFFECNTTTKIIYGLINEVIPTFIATRRIM